MLPLFTKPLHDLVASDVHQVVSERFPEGPAVEYKGELPAEQGRDPWYEGGKPSAYARSKIFKEVVAFANAYGGQLVLGIAETEEKPPRAERVVPIPRCHDLAERLRDMARDFIDPQISRFTSTGIVTDPDGNGVVLVRVGRSHQAPHRLTSDRHCYFRRADCAVPMDMREIQDLTLRTVQGTERLERLLAKRSEDFGGWYRGVGACVTAAPLWPLSVDRVFSQLVPHVRTFGINITMPRAARTVEVLVPRAPFMSERPILRGLRRTNDHGRFPAMQEMYSDGLAEIKFWVSKGEEEPTVSPTWVLGAAANVLWMVDRFRSFAEEPEMEYALRVELASATRSIRLANFWPDTFDPFYEDHIVTPCILPTLSVHGRETFGEVLRLVASDLLNSAGAPAFDQEFELVLPE